MFCVGEAAGKRRRYQLVCVMEGGVNNMMYGFVALLVVVLVPAGSSNQPLYPLSPELPPTAFVGQPYACHFQATGLSPLFSFAGLPRGFVGEPSGLLRGTPANSGTFLLTVSFASTAYSSSRQTLLRVAQPPDFPVNTNSSSAQYPAFAVSADIDSFVFMAGTQVSLRFSAVMGREPYLWTFLRLPTELAGAVDGALSGCFAEEGYFSFGVVVADRNGRSAYSFITLNIQPLTFFTQWAPQALRPIADVPVRNSFSDPASQQAWNNYQTAAQQLVAASQAASASERTLKEAQKNMTKFTYTLELAKQFVEASEKQLGRATAKRDQAEYLVDKSSGELAVASRRLGERQSALAFAQYNTNSSRKKLVELQSICAKLAQLLSKASSDLSDAQNNLTQAASRLHKAQITFNDSQDSLAITLSEKDLASLHFQNVSASSQRVFGDVEKARGEVDASKQSVSLATNAFSFANSSAEAALKALKEANEKVSTLSRAAGSAQSDLGQAQMRLALALNQLYVASAAKEQADKAMAIVSAQLAHSQETTFSGCVQGAFPSFFGSSQIASTIPQGFLLQSGQRLLYGSCSKGAGGAFSEGETVSFEGYLREGAIHALKLSKLAAN